MYFFIKKTKKTKATPAHARKGNPNLIVPRTYVIAIAYKLITNYTGYEYCLNIMCNNKQHNYNLWHI